MTTTHVPPSGRQFAIEAGPYAAVIVEVGGGLRTLHHGEQPLIDGYETHELADGARGQLLLPWPNRIRDGRYSFGGRDHQVEISEPAQHNALHGFCRWVGWREVVHDNDRVVLSHRLPAREGYPFTLDLEVEYTVHATDGLSVRMSATNVGADPAPFAAGAHPYLTAGTSRLDECTLHLLADTWLPSGDQQIPTGRAPVAGTSYDLRSPRPLAGLAVDHAFTGLRRDDDGRAWVTLTAEDGTTVSLWADAAFPYVMLFTGDTLGRPGRRRAGLGVEPMTSPPNAFATGEDLVVLRPGQAFTGRWGMVTAH